MSFWVNYTTGQLWFLSLLVLLPFPAGGEDGQQLVVPGPGLGRGGAQRFELQAGLGHACHGLGQQAQLPGSVQLRLRREYGQQE